VEIDFQELKYLSMMNYVARLNQDAAKEDGIKLSAKSQFLERK
jgi:hypothetical protein